MGIYLCELSNWVSDGQAWTRVAWEGERAAVCCRYWESFNVSVFYPLADSSETIFFVFAL